ncbi:MAG: enoyl-CoA hydratase/isomerase family protein [Dehalococcoidia bacterium]
MAYEFLLTDVDGPVTTLTLNRPERLNALNADIGEELLDAISVFEHDDEQRVLILAGAGRAFCSGDDLKGDGRPRKPREEELDRIKVWLHGPGRWPLIAKSLLELPKPVIARVHGPAYGAGFELALAADFRILSDEATLAFPVNQLALLWGVAQLPRLVGVAKAKEILMLENTLTADDALRLGLATEVVPLQELPARTLEVAQRLAQGPRRTYAGIKKGLHQSLDATLYQAYEYQGYALAINAFSSADADEGRRAFLEKRDSSF